MSPKWAKPASAGLNQKQSKPMNTFNKYQFLHELQKELFDAVATNQIESEDQVWDIINQTIDNAVIYYADCFAIIASLNVTHWTRFGRIDTIEFLASCALNEFVREELNLQDILNVLEQQ